MRRDVVVIAFFAGPLDGCLFTARQSGPQSIPSSVAVAMDVHSEPTSEGYEGLPYWGPHQSPPEDPRDAKLSGRYVLWNTPTCDSAAVYVHESFQGRSWA